MPRRAGSDTRIAIAAGTSAFAVAAFLFARDHWNSIYDDAFIYLRYARNLDAGCGLRFNCSGDAVEGFTSPLFLGLLWLGTFFTKRLIDLSQVIGTIALIGAAGFAISAAAALGSQLRDDSPLREDSLLRRLPGLLAVATALALALDHYVLLNANIGLETSLAALTCSLLAFAVVTKRPRLTATASVLAMLARPEAVLFVIALPLLPWLRRPRYLAPVAGAVVLLAIARLVVFGALAPNTYYAKAGGSLRHLELGAAYIADVARDFPLTALAALALLARPREIGFVLVVAGAWLAFFLRSGGDTFEYSRLWFPIVPALTAFALAGVAALAMRYGSRVAALAAPAVLALVIGGRAAVVHAIPEQHANPRVVEWAAIGSYLRATYPRGTLVATVPIGAIGYYSSLPILDLVGLTDATIARAGRSVPADLLAKRWIGHERHHTEYVLDRAPGVIVTTMVRDQPWRTLGEARAGFWADWLLLQEIKRGVARYVVRDAEVLPGRHVLMFERTP